jgi:stage V sporulation protein R
MKRMDVKLGSGREKLFEMREIESDISFIRNNFTKQLCDRLDMYTFQKQG